MEEKRKGADEDRPNRPLLPRPEAVKPEGRARMQAAFLDVNLSKMVPGLTRICEEHGIHPDKRDYGELIIFMNTARTYLKVMACNRTRYPVIACHRLARGRVYDLAIVGEIPRAFKLDGTVDMSQALRKAVERHMQRQKATAIEVAERLREMDKRL